MFLCIIIPVWNDEKLLNECLDSCLNQELSEDDYEIICVDDGSTDRTPEILRDYEARHMNIRVIEKEHTGGGGRDVGLAAATADYIWFVDHDDIVAPHAVDELKRIASENSGYDRILFPCYRFNDSLTEEERELMEKGELRQNFSFPPLDWYAWSSILKRAFLVEKKILPRSSRIQEAGSFWRINDYQIWGGDWAFIDECIDNGVRTFQLFGRALYHYRVHSASATQDASPEAVEKRAQMRYNMALYRGYRAWAQKQTYLAERATYGKARPETAEKLMGKLHDAVNFLSMQLDEQWKRGLRQFQEKEIFLNKRPEECKSSFWNYWKQLSWKEKLLPHLIAFYFSYTKVGASLYWSLSWQIRFKRRLKKK